jgi:hypothetical protein
VRIRSKRQSRKIEKPCSLARKKGARLQEDVVAKENSAIKKKSNILYQGNRKYALRVSQELTKPHSSQDQWCKGFNSLERLCFESS